MVMRKMMAGMGLVALPLVSLGASVLPNLFFIALLLGGGNLTAGATTIFTALVGIAALLDAVFALSLGLAPLAG
jgi:hypothetical protein